MKRSDWISKYLSNELFEGLNCEDSSRSLTFKIKRGELGIKEISQMHRLITGTVKPIKYWETTNIQAGNNESLSQEKAEDRY